MKEREHHDLAPDDEALVERLVRGDIDPSEAERDPRLRRILTLQRGLEAAAASEPGKTAGEASGGRDPVALEDRAEDIARRRLQQAAPGSASVARPRLLSGARGWLLSAAALALLGLSLWLLAGGGTGTGARIVGDDEEFQLHLLDPTEVRLEIDEDGATSLSFDAVRRLGVEYEVTVYSVDPAEGGVVLARSFGLDEPRWDPASDQEPGETPVNAWPKTVWIEVRESRLTATDVEVLHQGLVRR